MINSSEVKEQILGTISDDIADFLYYDRKEDELLPRGAIDEAVAMGVITVDEIVEHFRNELVKGLRT